MDQYAVAVIPVVAVYVGWTIKMMVEATRNNSATAAKLDMIVVRQDRTEDRLDALIATR